MSATFALVLLLLHGLGLQIGVVEASMEATVAAGSLPDDPCDLLTAGEMAEITGLQVISARRVPSITQIVAAQQEAREAEPGVICSFDTNSRFGAIAIAVPPQAERLSAVYWQARSDYFATFPGSAQSVDGLGKDAWIGGGASLRVLVGADDFFMVSTQMYQRDSRALLTEVARAILRRQWR
jgi:hypothetical protein